MAGLRDLFGGGGGGGLFGHPAPAPADYGTPRTPFQRVLDPEAQRTTLTGFLGRVAGNPTQGERAGGAMGEVMQKWGELRQSGIPANQAFIQLTQDPSFMEAFIQSPDAGRLVTEILNTDIAGDPTAADPMNIAPGGAVYQPGQGELYRNPTEKLQTFGGLASIAGLPPEREAELAEAMLMDDQSGDSTQTERATQALMDQGLLTNQDRIKINAGLIQRQQQRDKDGNLIDVYDWIDATTNQPWKAGGPAAVPDANAVNSGMAAPPPAPLPTDGGSINGGEGGSFSGGGPTAQRSPYFRTVTQAPAQFQPLYQQAAQRYGINPDLLAAQGYAESGWRPGARSNAGAIGISQFLPGTAKEYGVNPLDPASSIDGQARYMKKALNRYQGDEAAALVAYNAGFGTADKYVACGKCMSVLKGETRGYLAKILGGQHGAAYIDAVSGPASAMKPSAYPSMRGKSIRPFNGQRGTDMLTGDPASDDMLGAVPPGEGETLPLGMTELDSTSDGEPMSGPEAALGSGTFQSIAEFLGDTLGEVIENPNMVPQTVRERREYLRNLRENVVRYADASGREAAQEGQRIMDLAPKMGIWTNPVKALTQMIALRQAVAEQTKADWAIAENIDPRTGKPATSNVSGQSRNVFSDTQRQDAAVRASGGELLLKQIGSEADLRGAMERAQRIQGTSRWSFLVDVLRGAETDMETVLGEGGEGGGLKPEQMNSIIEGLSNGREPSDALLDQMSTEQLQQAKKAWEQYSGGKAK